MQREQSAGGQRSASGSSPPAELSACSPCAAQPTAPQCCRAPLSHGLKPSVLQASILQETSPDLCQRQQLTFASPPLPSFSYRRSSPTTAQVSACQSWGDQAGLCLLQTAQTLRPKWCPQVHCHLHCQPKPPVNPHPQSSHKALLQHSASQQVTQS